MKRNRIIAFVCCTLFAMGLMIFLYALSPIGEQFQPGGFTRSYARQLFMQKSEDLKASSFYIAGVADSTVYLGNTVAIDYMAYADYSLRNLGNMRITMPMDSVRSPGSFKLTIDSPCFYLMNGVEPVVLRGKLGDSSTIPMIRDSLSFFAEALPIGDSSFALKALNAATKEMELAKNSSGDFYFNDNLLRKQVDGIFCVDGRMHLDRKNNLLLYIYFYRNEFIVMDTSLQLKYRGNTIDTFTHAQIQVAALRNGTQNMLSRPPGMINGLSCISGNSLYVQSMVMAENDDRESFLTATTIDEYDIVTGKYNGSFYIPRFKNQLLKSFQIVGDAVFAIYGNHLVRYDFVNSNLQKL